MDVGLHCFFESVFLGVFRVLDFELGGLLISSGSLCRSGLDSPGILGCRSLDSLSDDGILAIVLSRRIRLRDLWLSYVKLRGVRFAGPKILRRNWVLRFLIYGFHASILTS
jgi:hypothetical protein